MEPTQYAIRASTQDHLEIEDIKEDIVILKDGGACVVISVSSINYDLLSEKEQEAVVWAYAALLNSLTFPIQILIRSQQKDVSSYLKLLRETAEKETRPLIRKQILDYEKFVGEVVKKNNVLDKNFYIVIPMSPTEIGAIKAFKATFSPGKRKLPFDKNYILQKAKINLYPKRDHILRLLGRLGIKGHPLTNQELIKLYFQIYNPESPGQQIISENQYQKPMIQSIISPPPSSPMENKSSPTEDKKKSNKLSSERAESIVFEKINNLVKNSIPKEISILKNEEGK